MPKKDSALAVRGMLSAVGAQTRRPVEVAPPITERVDTPSVTGTEAVQPSVSALRTAAAEQTRGAAPDSAEPIQESVATPAVTVTEEVQASVSPLPTAPQAVTATATAPEAPRTLRLRPTTAQRLREAWLQAKRDDVLLTAQDFASDLVEEALASRWRLPAGTS